MSSQILCWFCLKPDCWNSPLPIFSDNFALPTKIHDLFGIELKRNDSLQQFLCHSCLAKIAFMDEFATQVKSSTSFINSFTARNSINSPVTADTSIANLTNSFSEKKNPVVQVTNIKATISEVMDTSSVDVQPNMVLRRAQVKHSTPLQSTVKEHAVFEPVKKVDKVTKYIKCPNCIFYTTSKEQFENHSKKNYKCSICGVRSCSEKGIKIHRRRAHRLKIAETEKNSKTEEKSVNEISKAGSPKVFHGFEATPLNSQKTNEGSESSFKNIEYPWCEMCDEVFLSSKDLNNHNEKYHSSLYEEQNAKKIVNKKKPGRKKKTVDCNTSDNTSGLIVDKETPDKLPVVRLNSLDLNTTEKTCSSSESTPSIKIKKRPGPKPKTLPILPLDIFHCWKCKKDYQNRDQLFVHTCNPEGEEGDEINIKGESVEPRDDVQMDTSNENVSTCFVNVNNPKIEAWGQEENAIENDDGIMELSDSDDDTEILLPEPTRNVDPANAMIVDCDGIPPSNDDENNYCAADGDTVINVSLGNSDKSNENINVFGLKKCNECGDTFSNLKELFLHKRIHKDT